ncbi:MAG: tRNA (adenosine(37)-N6)-threonylcarbamoyltransferase complex dimerization subunit type 1 TsaB [Dysgonamonadaceae bacterium]|jgi:tRNA threonylcarbamoyladenosine biosynthesis protein TsaB|nr:tRNA (adenosine(37)-N6)-threonylcarbamoyltransferase complex dimerization subunit type 1 TsaB [Dysgonamonadaceae bacterium]
MSVILHIETASKTCSVAVFGDNEFFYEKISRKGESHSSFLGIFAQEALNFLKSEKIRLDAVALSSGPGSYTGLRIGASFAKGLCYGLDIPLIAVPTLKIMANSVLEQNLISGEALLVPMLDARRMEVYSAVYDAALNEIRATEAEIIDENSYKDLLDRQKAVFFGDGSDKCSEVIKSPNAIFLDGINPSARAMASLAADAFERGDFVSTAYFEPFYLKEFMATKAKNKVIGNAKR